MPFRAEIYDMGLKKLIALLVLVAFPAIAFAGDEKPSAVQTHIPIQTQIYVSDDGATLYLIGPVNYGTYFDFMRVVRKNPKIKTLFLGSEGGTAVDGLLIANQTRRRGFNTHVGHYCASTCTQIFMAGTKRSAHPLAKIGFHKSYLVDEKGVVIADKVLAEGEEKDPANLSEALGLDGDAALRLSYSRAGLTKAFIDHVLTVPGSEMWHPERAELESEGVLNTAPPVPALAEPKDSLSLEQVRATVAGNAFWVAVAKQYPDIGEQAVLSLWRARNVGVDPEAAYWSAREPLVIAANTQFAAAPDAIVDQMAVHNGWNAAMERTHGYPSCAQASINFVPPSKEVLVLIDAQEKLMIAAMTGDKTGKALDPEKAVREYEKSWREFAAFGLIEPQNTEDPHQSCRQKFQIDESIAKLEPKKRIKTSRALLSIPKTKPDR